MTEQTTHLSSDENLTATRALERLTQGNQEFTAGLAAKFADEAARFNPAAQNEAPQKPFAIILCCSDWQIPPEIAFCQPPGALYVIQTAGNRVEAAETESAAFAVARYETRLIVVLGHSRCAALAAALNGQTVRAQVRAVAARLRQGLEPLIQKKGLRVIEAEYITETGLVEFLHSDNSE